jgi:hypothetical protein
MAAREGLALANRLAPHTLRAEMELLQGFTADERDFLVRLLKRMLGNVLATAGSPRGGAEVEADDADVSDERSAGQKGGHKSEVKLV